MGIDVRLESEFGYELDFQGDPKGRTYALLPLDEESAYPFLTSIDPHGNTVFNGIQMSRFLAEWAYAESAAETDYDRELVQAVKRMATRCRDNVHLYLKFIGD